MAYYTLNESNLQNCFYYNGTDGTEQYKDIKGALIISLDKPYCVNPLDSDFIVIDLGYTIDGQKQDWNFIIDGKGANIQACSTRQDISSIVMQDNDVLIVTDDSYFRTVIMIKYRAEVLGKTLEYSFKSFNTSLSSFMLDTIAQKLNKYNPEEVETRFINAEDRIKTSEGNITNLETKSNELDTNIKEKETKITNLETKTEGLSRTVDENTQEATSLISDNLTVNKNGIITGTLTVNDNTVLKDTTCDNLTVNNDLELKGNVKGQLKDADGYKYVKIKTGTITDNNLTNLTIEAKEDGSAIIKGEYIYSSADNIESLKTLERSFVKPTLINSINSIQMINKNKFELLTMSILENNLIKVIFRNVSDATVNNNGASYNIIIDCKVDLTSSSIKWN